MWDPLPALRQVLSDSRLCGEQMRYESWMSQPVQHWPGLLLVCSGDPPSGKQSTPQPLPTFFSTPPTSLLCFCYYRIIFTLLWTQEYNLSIWLKSKLTKLTFTFLSTFPYFSKFLITRKKVTSALRYQIIFFLSVELVILLPWFLEAALIFYCSLLLGQQFHGIADWFSCFLL